MTVANINEINEKEYSIIVNDKEYIHIENENNNNSVEMTVAHVDDVDKIRTTEVYTKIDNIDIIDKNNN